MEINLSAWRLASSQPNPQLPELSHMVGVLSDSCFDAATLGGCGLASSFTQRRY